MSPFRLVATDLQEKTHVFENILSAEQVVSLDSPADALEVRFLQNKGSLSPPPEFYRLRLEQGGNTLFSGLVDEENIFLGQGGMEVELTARSPGSLLLDNEALPMDYYQCSLEDLFGRCIAPYNMFSWGNIPMEKRRRRLALFTVQKGWSEWDAIKEFCMQAFGMPPSLNGALQLELGWEMQKSTTVSNGQKGVRYSGFGFYGNRAQVISKVCLRDSRGNYTTAVESPYAQRLRVRRKRYLIPGYNTPGQPKADADRLITRAMAKKIRGVLTLPDWVALRPGEGVTLPDPSFPMSQMTVTKVQWQWKGERVQTIAELRDPHFPLE